MAIAYDNVSPDTTGSGASLTSGAWTISGSDRLLLGFLGNASGPTREPTGMKWDGSGGTALTQIGSTLTIGSFGRLGAYRLIAPTASSLTLYGSFDGAADSAALGGDSYTGVDQTTPVGTPATNTGAIASSSGDATVTITTTVGDLVVAGLYLYDNSFHSPASAPGGSPTPTERYEAGTADELMAIQEVVATGSSTTVTFTVTGTTTMDAFWGIIAFVVNPVAGGGGGGGVSAAWLTA